MVAAGLPRSQRKRKKRPQQFMARPERLPTFNHRHLSQHGGPAQYIQDHFRSIEPQYDFNHIVSQYPQLHGLAQQANRGHWGRSLDSLVALVEAMQSDENVNPSDAHYIASTVNNTLSHALSDRELQRWLGTIWPDGASRGNPDYQNPDLSPEWMTHNILRAYQHQQLGNQGRTHQDPEVQALSAAAFDDPAEPPEVFDLLADKYLDQIVPDQKTSDRIRRLKPTPPPGAKKLAKKLSPTADGKPGEWEHTEWEGLAVTDQPEVQPDAQAEVQTAPAKAAPRVTPRRPPRPRRPQAPDMPMGRKELLDDLNNDQQIGMPAAGMFTPEQLAQQHVPIPEEGMMNAISPEDLHNLLMALYPHGQHYSRPREGGEANQPVKLMARPSFVPRLPGKLPPSATNAYGHDVRQNLGNLYDTRPELADLIERLQSGGYRLADLVDLVESMPDADAYHFLPQLGIQNTTQAQWNDYFNATFNPRGGLQDDVSPEWEDYGRVAHTQHYGDQAAQHPDPEVQQLGHAAFRDQAEDPVAFDLLADKYLDLGDQKTSDRIRRLKPTPPKQPPSPPSRGPQQMSRKKYAQQPLSAEQLAGLLNDLEEDRLSNKQGHSHDLLSSRWGLMQAVMSALRRERKELPDPTLHTIGREQRRMQSERDLSRDGILRGLHPDDEAYLQQLVSGGFPHAEEPSSDVLSIPWQIPNYFSRDASRDGDNAGYYVSDAASYPIVSGQLGDDQGVQGAVEHLQAQGYPIDEQRAKEVHASRRQGKAPLAKLSGVHSPGGGVVVRGMHYPGGQFVPNAEVEKASYKNYSHVRDQRTKKYSRDDGSFDSDLMVLDKQKAR